VLPSTLKFKLISELQYERIYILLDFDHTYWPQAGVNDSAIHSSFLKSIETVTLPISHYSTTQSKQQPK
jgi:hypothetical protein